MNPFEFPQDVVDRESYGNAIAHLRAAQVVLPTFAELADPAVIASDIRADTKAVPVAAAHSANLFRIHWYNTKDGTGLNGVPDHIVLESPLTGVAAPIIVALGDRFPMIGAHKVLPAYACLAARLVSGLFDPTRHRAVWPSTGNYCRGGVAVSRILGCRGVAVLPEGMSRERFDWLEQWVGEPQDIVKTPGSESNVKEIYDKCAELAGDPGNVILNQFSEFANYLVHFQCTGRALERIVESYAEANPELRLAAFVAGTGSAGTLAAGDYLKDRHGSRIVAVEPVECPTMLYNGYGEHNIQGIGDKHIPLIQNVMNTDVVAGVSDESCDSLNVLFNTDVGRRYLAERRGIDPDLVDGLQSLGLSGIANVLAAIKTARLLDLGEDDAIVTVATDSAALYVSERNAKEATFGSHGFDAVAAGEVFGRHLQGLGTEDMLETRQTDRRRIFNLGYYTWVEQQGIELADFDRRRDQRFWKGLQDLLPVWDGLIEEFNRQTGVNRPS